MADSFSPSTLPAGVTLRQATADDIPEMIAVINAAFEAENFFVSRPRTHAAQLTEHLRSGHFLLAHQDAHQDENQNTNQGAQLIASIYYELRGSELRGGLRGSELPASEFRRERGYIGMLAVRPDQQHRGLGRTMMHHAEQALRDAGCRVAELSVVSVRTTLPPFYHKLGYVEAGLAKVPEELQQKLTMPVQLIRMEKPL
jgi:ribosomal protein S18 acetylase RimI-like enzyme